MDEALVISYCVVRLVTAVEAVRRKKKAAVRLWVALSEEDCIGLWWEKRGRESGHDSGSINVFIKACEFLGEIFGVFATQKHRFHHIHPQNQPRLRIIRLLRFLYTH